LGWFALRFSPLTQLLPHAFEELEPPLRAAGVGFVGALYGMHRVNGHFELTSYHRGQPDVFPARVNGRSFDAITVVAAIGPADLLIGLTKLDRGTALAIKFESDLYNHNSPPGWLGHLTGLLLEAFDLELGVFDLADSSAPSAPLTVAAAEILYRIEGSDYLLEKRPLFAMTRTAPQHLVPPPAGSFRGRTPTGFFVFSWL